MAYMAIGSSSVAIYTDTKSLIWGVKNLEHPVSTIKSNYSPEFNKWILDTLRTTHSFITAALLRLPVVRNPRFPRWLQRYFLKDWSWRISTLGIKPDIEMAANRPSRSSRHPGASLVCLGRNSLGSLQLVGNIGLDWPTLNGKSLDAHEFKFRLLLTNPDIISKEKTKDGDIM